MDTDRNSGDPQILPPPRRGSFQVTDYVSPAVQSSERPTTSGKLDPNDETGSTIYVIDDSAAAENGGKDISSRTIELDDDAMLTDDDVGFTKSSSGSRRQSTSVAMTALPSGILHKSPSSEGSIVDTSNSAYQLPTDPQLKTGKLRNKYVMPDGTVVNGKGLGRGRPGIKRGPRRSTLSNEISGTPDGDSITLSTPSPAPQAVSTSGKRKRADSDPDISIDRNQEDEFSPSSKESTPEYNPSASTQTRFGRQSQKPAPIVQPSSSQTKPVAKRPSLPQTTSSPAIKKHPKIKAKVYRGREQFALCEHCLRGNGPPGNVIVFCDACNKCWHQSCHAPRISKEVVADTKAEWYCAECDRILHGKKKVKAVPKPNLQPSTVPIPAIVPSVQPIITKPIGPPRYGLPYIPGMALTPTQRKQYLNSLPKEKLIEIVLRAADLAPNMPIFETPLHEMPQPPLHQLPPPNQFPFATLPKSMRPPLPQSTSVSAIPIPTVTPTASTPLPPPRVAAAPTIPIFSHPTAGTPTKPNTAPLLVNADDDEGYYDDFDELALIYPKPGEGVYDLVLPPESNDLHIMLEAPDRPTFSHWVRGRGSMKSVVEGAR